MKPGRDPLTPNTVVVQGPGMECWIAQSIARDYGILANAVFPFRRAGSLVLPTTMPADDRLLLLGYQGLDLLAILRRKWSYVREVSGLCHFLTHPEPHLFGRRLLRDIYRALIEEIQAEGDAWITTPSELAAWWRDAEAGPES